MFKLSRKEVLKGRAKKGKSKGNLKGKIKIKKCTCKYLCESSFEIPKSFDVNLRGEYLLINTKQLEEIMRRIVREETQRLLKEFAQVTGKDLCEDWPVMSQPKSRLF